LRVVLSSPQQELIRFKNVVKSRANVMGIFENTYFYPAILCPVAFALTLSPTRVNPTLTPAQLRTSPEHRTLPVHMCSSYLPRSHTVRKSKICTSQSGSLHSVQAWA